MEPVTTILLERQRDRGGLKPMVTFSFVGHGAMVAAIVLMPAFLWQSAPPTERNVMTISLGGAPGPATGGMTMLGGRPIQFQAPLPDMKRPEPIRPAAAATPEMTMPSPDAKKTASKTPVKNAVDEAKGRTPSRGAEERPGSAVAETGARGQGFGLSTSGGGGSGGYLDVSDFCCPEYLVTMKTLIERNWNSKTQVSGVTLMKFTILRTGRLVDIEVERSSGVQVLDINAQRALVQTELPALPRAFTEDRLPVHMNFEYKR